MNNDRKAADVLRWMAWTVLFAGAVIMAFTASDFRSENLPLMVSIGFLIAGMNIFIMSTVFRLMTLKRTDA
ncbi:hypothetical protein ABE237_07710 [Brevibacillus formosus]|uniref:Uncharacterized protein n=1 Tax=Brevibacillus formosus TaxID=54913 RepID=A0A837KNC0_9BACL|nr:MULTISPECIES: hypothetical protein [Brevibacillus]KLH98156.1 hypothetical protein AA984_14135 [Brevibacillus formosus]MBG9943461.1 hypothetical protein [Brevibacillus formosus]MBW5467770.1 hypothetical protein [Brevibacillus formosus]MED1948000.1 hypothetical protein [Brevibacillus formosus]MED1956972.1 hypothetical protein [Brevibacillus formosus]